MPKLYTKTGDNGTTSLYDGSRLKKNSIFFDVLGDLDELASHIGLLSAKINDESLNICIEFNFSYSIKIILTLYSHSVLYYSCIMMLIW